MSATIDVLNPDRPKRVLIVASNPGPEGRVTGARDVQVGWTFRAAAISGSAAGVGGGEHTVAVGQ